MVFQRERAIQRSGEKTWFMINKSEEVPKTHIEYKNANMLLDLFATLKEKEEKDELVYVVAEKMREEEDCFLSRNGKLICEYGSSALAFYTLVRIGFVKEAVEYSQRKIQNGNCFLLFSLLSDLLSEDYNYFSVEEYNSLMQFSDNIDREKSHNDLINLTDLILNKMTDIGCRMIQEEIRGINIEINRDKESVVQKIAILGMGDEYEQFLNDLDFYISSSSGLVASGMIGNFRNFWEKIIIELSKKIYGITKGDLPQKLASPIANARLYIKEQLELSDSDNSLINHYVSILHAEGGHAFTSNVEYFRLSRNIGIEILLLLLTKTEFLKNRMNRAAG